MNEVEQEKVVVRGLENVAAAETCVSYVDGVNCQLFNPTTDCDEFNPAVIDWLIEYNFNCPHQGLII